MSFENESISRPAAATAESSHSRLLEDTFRPADTTGSGASANNSEYIDKMSSTVADALNKAYIGDSRPAKELTDALKPLTGADRNKLLQETKEKNDQFAHNNSDSNHQGSMQHLQLDRWDEKTGT